MEFFIKKEFHFRMKSEETAKIKIDEKSQNIMLRAFPRLWLRPF